MSWQDLRDSTDAALKAMALLPGAREADDSEILEAIGKLSAALRHVDHFVDELGIQLDADGGDDGESSTVSRLESITRNGGRSDG